MIWIVVLIAGLLEIVWAVGLRYTDGFTRLWPSVGTLLAMGLSFFLLSLAMRSLPTGTVYAVWVGIGAVGTAVVGITFLGEPATLPRLLSISLIIMGIVGLKLSA
jgi:quaternary ammonium compound-resistance protein SugE